MGIRCTGLPTIYSTFHSTHIVAGTIPTSAILPMPLSRYIPSHGRAPHVILLSAHCQGKCNISGQGMASREGEKKVCPQEAAASRVLEPRPPGGQPLTRSAMPRRCPRHAPAPKEGLFSGCNAPC